MAEKKTAETSAADTKSTPARKPASKAAAAKSTAAVETVERVQTLKVHHLRPAPGAKTARTRVGRGEGSKGKTAGRGTKGTKARYQVKAGFAGGQLPLHMRLPKLRGFKNPFRVEFQVVNLDKLNELFPEGGEVSVDSLVAKGAVRKNQLVKVLGTGDINVKVDVKVHAFSASAAEKISAAGGSVSAL